MTREIINNRASCNNRILVQFNSMLIAYFADVQALNLMISKIFPGAEGVLLSALYYSGLLLFVLLFVFGIRSFKPPKLTTIFIATVIVLFYVLSPYLNVDNEVTFPYLISFTLFPFILPQLFPIDVRTLVKTMMILPAFGVLFLTRVFALDSWSEIGMDISYALLAPVVASIVFYFCYWNTIGTTKSKFIFSTFLVINAIYFIYIAIFGSRGPTLSAVLCLLFLIIFRQKKTGGINLHSRKFFILLLLIILIVLNFETVVIALDGVLSKNGIDSGTLTKMMRLIDSDNLVDERDTISAVTWKAIGRSPFLGYGIGCSPFVINYTYPHNFFLQMLLEGGGLMTTLVLFPIVRSLINWYKKCSFDSYVLITVFFFSAVIGALFSLNVWMNLRFWLCAGLIMMHRTYKDKIKTTIA